MKNLKKKLEETAIVQGFDHLGTKFIRVKNKETLKAVLPLLKELQEEYWKIMSQPLRKRKGMGSFRQFLEELLEE